MPSSAKRPFTYGRIVVKVGTSTLTDEHGRIDVSYIASLIKQISKLREMGSQVALVTSGAIAAGLERLGLESERPGDMPTLQAAAAIGSVELVSRYSYCAGAYGLQVAQVLITRHDTSSRSSYLHARDTLERLMELGVVPIVNENDTVATEEIRFGDNDTLAATVATTIGAQLVVLLSDIEGLYTADPRKSDDAELIERVGTLSDQIVEAAGGSGTNTGSGGMATKIKAARVLMSAGIPLVICQGREQDSLLKAVLGEGFGTKFESETKLHRLTPKKLWIALGDVSYGKIIADDGAVEALRGKGASLLPVGVVSVEGDFKAGQPVDICDSDGRIVAKGIAAVESSHARSNAGLRSSQIAHEHPDGADAPHHIVHRDEMIVF